MNPADNVELAKFLARPPPQPPEEASFRAACGRAYYAAHAVARDVLHRARFRLPKSGEAHGEVVSLLKSSRISDVQAAGGLLDQLRATRKSADYHVGDVPVAGSSFEKRRADVALMQATSIIATVSKYAQADRSLGIPHQP